MGTRFVLTGGFGFGGFGGGGGIAQTVANACTEVPSTTWSNQAGQTTTVGGGTLYDCRGKADAISRTAAG